MECDSSCSLGRILITSSQSLAPPLIPFYSPQSHRVLQMEPNRMVPTDYVCTIDRVMTW
jgi:hypothetical protein